MFTDYPGIKLEWAVWKWKIVGKCYVYLTAKQVISCRGYDEKGCEICKNEKCTCKACKTTDFCRRICKSVKFLSSILLKLPIILAWPNWASLVSQIFNCLHGLRYFVAAGDPSNRNNFSPRKQGAKQEREARTSSENVTSGFCNHFAII